MTTPRIIRLKPRTTGYGDTAALNDIHALLTTSQDPAADLLGDVGTILTRSGRPMVAVRDIDACITETPTGRPVARDLPAASQRPAPPADRAARAGRHRELRRPAARSGHR